MSVGVAAAAMVATLPGRTHGLGLVTEPLLADLKLERVPYAAVNLWATLIGSAFCLPVGWLLDRIGVRIVLSGVLAGLGAVVVGMAALPAAGAAALPLPAPELFEGRGVEWVRVPPMLFVLVLLTRGLGQSALSVVSLALVGKVAGRKPGLVIGVYSFLVAVGFMMAFATIKVALEKAGADWRDVWAGIGWVLIVAAPLLAAFVPSLKGVAAGPEAAAAAEGVTLWRATATPAFWVFGLATSFYGLVAAGLSLFHQSILAERDFKPEVFRTITVVSPVIGLAANLFTGWLALYVRIGRLLAAALALLAVALALFPFVATLTEVYAYAAAVGVAGGMVTVVFFGVWRQFYGAAHLGQIQGAAQLLAVFASALGPLVLAGGQRALGSYAPVIQGLAAVSLTFAVLAWVVPAPRLIKPGDRP